MTARAGTADRAPLAMLPLALLLAAGLGAVAACGGAAGAPTGSQLPGVGSAAGVPGGAGTPAPVGSAGAGASAGSPAPGSPAAGSPAAAASGAVAIDTSLLDLLPARLAGLDRANDRDADAAVAGDPTVVSIGTGATTAFYQDPASGDQVLAVPIRLREQLSDAVFRDFRDTYGASFCEDAGGLVGAADSTVDGRSVSVSRCAGGALVYYVRLPAQRVLMVIDAIQGPALAEQLIAQLPR